MKNNLWNILKKELRELFRDKKSLAMMLVIPIFIPLLVIGMSALFESQTNQSVEEFNHIGFAYSLSEEEKQIAKEMKLDVIEGKEQELEKQYQNEDIDLYVTKEENHYIIHSDGSDTSSYATTLVEEYFNLYKQVLQRQYLEDRNVDANEVINAIRKAGKYLIWVERVAGALLILIGVLLLTNQMSALAAWFTKVFSFLPVVG